MSSRSSTPAEPSRLVQLRHCLDSLKGQTQPAAYSSSEQDRKTPEQRKRDLEKYDVVHKEVQRVLQFDSHVRFMLEKMEEVRCGHDNCQITPCLDGSGCSHVHFHSVRLQRMLRALATKGRSCILEDCQI